MCYKLFFVHTLALNSANKSPVLRDDWIDTTSTFSSLRTCITSNNNPSLYGHRSSTSASFSMIETSTCKTSSSIGGEPVIFAGAPTILPSTVLFILLLPFTGNAFTIGEPLFSSIYHVKNSVSVMQILVIPCSMV